MLARPFIVIGWLVCTCESHAPALVLWAVLANAILYAVVALRERRHV